MLISEMTLLTVYEPRSSWADWLSNEYLMGESWKSRALCGKVGDKSRTPRSDLCSRDFISVGGKWFSQACQIRKKPSLSSGTSSLGFLKVASPVGLNAAG